MRLASLQMESVGPFDRADLDLGSAPVTVITGENGTGKTFVLDVIRTLFGSQYTDRHPRPIYRLEEIGHIKFIFELFAPLYGDIRAGRLSGYVHAGQTEDSSWHVLNSVPSQTQNAAIPAPSWVVDYWAPGLPRGDFRVSQLASIDMRGYLLRSLSGELDNADTTQFICQVDYLRDSRDAAERSRGERLWSAVEQIVEQFVLDGKLERVLRAELRPVFSEHGREVGLEHLNAGSLYLIQHAFALLRRMYACHVTSGREGDEILSVPGVLLIDEAETHLHPKWQKRLLPMLRTLFPGLQIIVTTHSPFIVASAPAGSKIFVCEKTSHTSCSVRDVSGEYANLPIDEVLASAVFSGTPPYAEEITNLLMERKEAMARGDDAVRARIEQTLKRLNPDEFGYFDLPDTLRQALGKTA